METLLVIAQHRNQGYSRSKVQASHGFDSPPSTGFKGISCRAFQSCTGILQSPPPIFPSYHGEPDPKSTQARSEPPKLSRRSNPITICPNPSPKYFTFSDAMYCSELWAGPTYSNSPPPSSLPIPKFSLRQKRSISLHLPDSESSTLPQLEVKSAPASPVHVSCSTPADFFLTAASATENLRRILNLDLEN